MEFIKNLKISSKLLFLVSLGALFILVVGLVGFYFNHKASSDIATLYKNRVVPIETLSQLEIHIFANRANLFDIMASSNNQKKQAIVAEINRRAKESNQIIEDYSQTKLDSYETENLAKLKEQLGNYRSVRSNVIQLALSGKNNLALALLNKNNSKFNSLVDIESELVNYNVKAAGNIESQNRKDAVASTIILVGTILAALVLLVSLGLMITNMIANPIMKAVKALGESSDDVASASEELSAASQSLAEGSTEQAASIQETSATIEESASMVHQTSDNTKQAAILAKTAKDKALTGSQKMGEMMTSMDELQQSSHEISKIIKVIDEIAFQTNILALNAAVEAARAGDAGKGFAVVAEEVRNLAQRCAKAAQDTASIIESNIQLSAQGVDISAHVNQSLTEINEQSQKVSDLLDEVAVASQEQTQGIAQINLAISQMEQVIRANATTADQSASASEQLSLQAADMKHLVGTLAVLVHGAEALNHHGYRPSISQRETRFIDSKF